MEVPGYILDERICESSRALIVSGISEREGRLVAIKIQDVRSAEVEFELLQRAAGDVTPCAVELQRRVDRGFVVMERLPGVTADQLWTGRGLPISQWCNFALGFVSAIATLHRSRLVHTRIEPSHILATKDLRRVSLLGLRGAVDMDAPRRRSFDTDVGRPDPMYMAPELVGTSGIAPDAVADLYSVGVVLYEALLGSLTERNASVSSTRRSPWTNKITELREFPDDTPAAIVDVIRRLMARAPGTRYQSTNALFDDLSRIELSWRELGHCDGVTIGSEDVAERLRSTLAERALSKELAALRRAVAQACAGASAPISILGQPFSGQEELIRNLGQVVVRAGGMLIWSACDPIGSGRPFTPVSEAAELLVDQLIYGDTDLLASWTDVLAQQPKRALAELVELVPRLHRLLSADVLARGYPEEPPRPSSTVHRSFSALFRAASGNDRPLVIVLDNLQWCDASSVQMIYDLAELLAGSTVLLVLSLRGRHEERIAAEHDVSSAWSLTRRLGIDDLELAPLSVSTAEEWLATATQRSASEVQSLARHLLGPSGGLPGLMVQYLALLRERGVVHWTPRLGWRWSEDALAGSALPDGFAGYIVEQATAATDAERELLALTVHAGQLASTKVLAQVLKQPVQDVAAALEKLVVLGIIRRREGLFRPGHPSLIDYSRDIIVPAKLREWHLELARLLMDQFPEPRNVPTEDGSQLLVHLEASDPNGWVHDEYLYALVFCELRIQHALNLGEVSQASRIADFVRRLIKNHAFEWNQNSASPWSIWLAGARADAMLGHTSDARAYLELARPLATRRSSLSEWCETKIAVLVMLGAYEEAVQTGLEILGELGQRGIARRGGDKKRVLWGLLRLSFSLPRIPTEKLLNRPPCHDEDVAATQRVASALLSVSYRYSTFLYLDLVCFK